MALQILTLAVGPKLACFVCCSFVHSAPSPFYSRSIFPPVQGNFKEGCLDLNISLQFAWPQFTISFSCFSDQLFHSPLWQRILDYLSVHWHYSRPSTLILQTLQPVIWVQEELFRINSLACCSNVSGHGVSFRSKCFLMYQACKALVKLKSNLLKSCNKLSFTGLIPQVLRKQL